MTENNAMVAFTDRVYGRIASYKTGTTNRRASLFFRDDTATLLTEKGWHFFDSLVSWAVPRIDAAVSPTEGYVFNTENTLTFTMDNSGMGCYWETTVPDFDWLLPAFTGGKIFSPDNRTLTLNIDWSQFSHGETNAIDIGIPSGRTAQIIVVEKMRGDMNGNGVVDIIDALLTAQCYTNHLKQSIDLSAGDVKTGTNIETYANQSSVK